MKTMTKEHFNSVAISHDDLPSAAKLLMSRDQLSYIDEFTFYRLEDGRIEAEYARQIIAIWDGKGWKL